MRPLDHLRVAATVNPSNDEAMVYLSAQARPVKGHSALGTSLAWWTPPKGRLGISKAWLVALARLAADRKAEVS